MAAKPDSYFFYASRKKNAPDFFCPDFASLQKKPPPL
jgi:hypothetical protein